MNGASPFISAQPDRDIDSTPQAMPTPRSPALIAWAMLTRRAHRRAAEPVDRRAGDAVGEARRQRCPAADVAHPLVGRVHAAGDDVLDLIQRHADAFARALHRHAQQIVGPDVRQRAPVPRERGPHPAEDERISHRASLLCGRRRRAGRVMVVVFGWPAGRARSVTVWGCGQRSTGRRRSARTWGRSSPPVPIVDQAPVQVAADVDAVVHRLVHAKRVPRG